jgi:hypothetical protein
MIVYGSFVELDENGSVFVEWGAVNGHVLDGGDVSTGTSPR